jgi:hypothetical protein
MTAAPTPAALPNVPAGTRFRPRAPAPKGSAWSKDPSELELK